MAQNPAVGEVLTAGGAPVDGVLVSTALPGTVAAQQVSDFNHYSIPFAEHAVAVIVGALVGSSRTTASVSGRPSRRRAPDRSR